jgi:phenylacetate-CoA ligase
MVDRNYKPYGLEPIETASRDEISALQTQRLKWSLQHVYDNVPAYRKKFDAAGVTPSDFKRSRISPNFRSRPSTICATIIPSGLFAVPQRKSRASTPPQAQPASRPVVGYTKKDIDTWSGLMARSIRASGGRPGMKVHVSYGYGLCSPAGLARITARRRSAAR